jgi:hypothetical protein
MVGLLFIFSGHPGLRALSPAGRTHAATRDENGRKRTENRSTVFVSIFLNGNGSESRTAGSENGSGINGNTKTDKYDRKIDGNER